jgi:hypothetical protein
MTCSCLHLMLFPEISHLKGFVFLLSPSRQINYVMSTFTSCLLVHGGGNYGNANDKITVFWKMTPCSLVRYLCKYRENLLFSFQGTFLSKSHRIFSLVHSAPSPKTAVVIIPSWKPHVSLPRALMVTQIAGTFPFHCRADYSDTVSAFDRSHNRLICRCQFSKRR